MNLDEALTPLASLCDLITAERATRQLGNVTVTEPVVDKYGQMKTRKVTAPHPDRVLLSAGPGLFTAMSASELEAAVLSHPHLARAREITETVQAAHLPVAFPEVFRRVNGGFDCIVGNPPWDEVTVEAPKFWRRYMPGLMGLKTDQHARSPPPNGTPDGRRPAAPSPGRAARTPRAAQTHRTTRQAATSSR